MVEWIELERIEVERIELERKELERIELERIELERIELESKGIAKNDGYFDEFILIVINEALNIKEELHENGIGSNDVIQRTTMPAHVRLIDLKSVGGIWRAMPRP